MADRRPFQSARFSPFRGRVAEAATLREILDRRVPIILVTGLPGVGKSRLVAQVLGDRSLWIPAHEVEETGDLDPVVAQAARLAGDSRGTDGPITVVIDGLQQPGMVVAISEFVDEHPMFRFVVTSRVHLTVRGASSLRLTPFDLPTKAAAMTTHPHRWPAVECLLDHAAAADPAFRLSQDNAAHVIDLLRLSGGLPLAIELVTTWLGAMPIAAVERAAEGVRPSWRNSGSVDKTAGAYETASTRLKLGVRNPRVTPTVCAPAHYSTEIQSATSIDHRDPTIRQTLTTDRRR